MHLPLQTQPIIRNLSATQMGEIVIAAARSQACETCCQMAEQLQEPQKSVLKRNCRLWRDCECD